MPAASPEDLLTFLQKNQFGPYQVIERLGTGGMGDVFKARHAGMDRVVALKVIPESRVANPVTLQRFYREVRAVAKLSHPNVVTAFEVNQIGDMHYLAMEYVDGIDLARLVHQSGPLPVWKACDYIGQAALGLQHAHEKGLVHRDIKPGNIMVTRSGADGTPVIKILDFGLARFASESDQRERLTQLGKITGTVDYISPEQAENARTADIRADIYSLGCSLFYLLTARPPFQGDDLAQRIGARLLDDAPSVRKFRPEVAPALERVLAKMLARKPADRYQTPGEVAKALEPHSQDEKQETKPAATIPEKPVARMPKAPRAVESPSQTFNFAGTASAALQPGGKRTDDTRNKLLLVGGVAAAVGGVILIGGIVLLVAMLGGSKPSPSSSVVAGGKGSSSSPSSSDGGGKGSTSQATEPLPTTWKSLANMPTARSLLAAVTGPDGRIYAIGGENASGALDIVEVYDPSTSKWTTVAPMPTPRFHLAAAMGPDNLIYAIGGVGSNPNIVEAYNPNSNKWSAVAPMPTARHGLAAVTGPNGRIYAIGGNGPGGSLSTVEAYDTKSHTWTAVAPMPTARVYLAAAIGPDGRIYAIGGFVEKDGKRLNTVEAYDTKTNKWTTVARMPTARNALAAATGPDGHIYAIGGHPEGGNLNPMEAYDPSNDKWTPVASMPTVRGQLAATTGRDGRIYAIGGGGTVPFLNTVEALSFSSRKP